MWKFAAKSLICVNLEELQMHLFLRGEVESIVTERQFFFRNSIGQGFSMSGIERSEPESINGCLEDPCPVSVGVCQSLFETTLKPAFVMDSSNNARQL
jgi:hypothetical protein